MTDEELEIIQKHLAAHRVHREVYKAGSDPANGWTAPSSIPPDVARKILAVRDALMKDDTNEAWHRLYSIADPTFRSFTPWQELEKQSKTT